MKSQVFLSTGGIFEYIFIEALQDIPSQLIRVYLTTILHQVRMILILIGTVNEEEEIVA